MQGQMPLWSCQWMPSVDFWMNIENNRSWGRGIKKKIGIFIQIKCAVIYYKLNYIFLVLWSKNTSLRYMVVGLLQVYKIAATLTFFWKASTVPWISLINWIVCLSSHLSYDADFFFSLTQRYNGQCFCFEFILKIHVAKFSSHHHHNTTLYGTT